MNRPMLPRLAGAALATLLLGGTAHASFTVTGEFRYVDRPFTFNGFSATETTLPIRFASVEVIDAANGDVLAWQPTAEDGTVSIFVPGSGTKDIVVRCFSRTDQFGASIRVTNTSNVQYSLSSAVFPSWNLSTNLDVGTITAQKLLAGSSQGGPFNMLDVGIHALQYVKAQGSGNPSQTIRVQWPGGGGSFASGATANIADDDGFDDIVILHELGHVIHNLYSDSDSPGGTHGFGQSDQDPRLSFGEGWACFFAGAVRERLGVFDPGFYMDCAGQGQTGSASVQLRMRFENGSPYANSTGGEADEGAVFCALWDLIDDTATNDGNTSDDDPFDGSLTFAGGIDGHRMQWNVFTGPVDGASNLTIRDEWNGQFVPIAYGHADQLEEIYADWGMRFFEDAAEPNNAAATATPLGVGTVWSATRTLYFATSGAAPGEGDQDHYAFTMTQGATFEVETRYPGGNGDAETYCDTFLAVFRPDGSLFAQADGGGTGRNAKLADLVADASGTWTARVTTNHSYRKTGSYEIRVVQTASPQICGSPAAVATFGSGKAGVSGIPILAAPTPPVIGGAPLQLNVIGPPAHAGLLLMGLQTLSAPFDGGTLLVNPLFTLPVQTSPFGIGGFALALTDPGMCGTTLHMQAIFPNDPGATGFYKTSQSNRLSLTFGD